MIRKHIREQIEMRISFMKPECYNAGTCVLCGCTTTALQMANKSCDAPCYPEMMKKKNWEIFKNGHVIFDTNGRWKAMIMINGKDYKNNNEQVTLNDVKFLSFSPRENQQDIITISKTVKS